MNTLTLILATTVTFPVPDAGATGVLASSAILALGLVAHFLKKIKK